MKKTLLDKLESLLKNESAYCTEDGTLLKNKIAQDASQFSPSLLKLLLSDEDTKKAFFAESDGIIIFNSAKFAQFLSSKNFLPDSYTSYKNKIGLNATNITGGYSIFANQDVVLDFPYKDCILEGGQTKDDQKRAEIFYNEILAPEQVTNLLSPKAFCNAKRYDEKGEHKIDSISQNDNLIIRGNNLIALSSLLERYRGKVKCIYIDPPYNTGSDSFGYNDNFNHSTWLVFMKNRLELARKLLRDDGAIFVQIDHHELGYLQVLLDEIFGIDNKVQIISVKAASVSGFKSVNPGPIDVTEYILFYTKYKHSFDFKKAYVKTDYNKNYNKYLERHNSEDVNKWEFIPIKDKVLSSIGKTEKEMKNQFGDAYQIVIEEMISQYAFMNANSVISVRDLHKPTLKMKELQELSRINRDTILTYEKTNGEKTYLINGGAVAFYSAKVHELDGEKCVTELLSDFWDDVSWAGIANEGEVRLKNAKKPEKLLKRIIELATTCGDIVLDFHLGSGTTAAVAHKMGRQYIGVEQMDYIQTIAVERLKKVIAGEQGGISKAQGWQGGGSFVYCELASLNASYVERISSCKTESEIVSLIEEILQSDFVSSAVLPSKIDTNAADFKALSFDDKKRFALEILDKNLLYINEADMDDESENHKTLEMSDRKFTKSFYDKDGAE